VTREVFALPLSFLTVALLGGVRVADRIVLLPPPLFTLVLAFLLMGVMVRSGGLAPERLLNGARTPLANLSGAVVLMTLFLASAQAFHVAIPEYGLPRLLFSVFLFVLLMNTFAASPDRIRVLRSVLVIFGSAFVLKFIILAALSEPAGGWLKRTLGTLAQDAYRPVTGYIAFATIMLFIGALSQLPSRQTTALTRAS
jgi:hypothetical protein